jgi:hypothetical protein
LDWLFAWHSFGLFAKYLLLMQKAKKNLLVLKNAFKAGIEICLTKNGNF